MSTEVAITANGDEGVDRSELEVKIRNAMPVPVLRFDWRSSGDCIAVLNVKTVGDKHLSLRFVPPDDPQYIRVRIRVMELTARRAIEDLESLIAKSEDASPPQP